MRETGLAIAAGVATGVLLLVVGYLLGRRQRKRSDALSSLLPDSERDRMLEMMRGLEEWTQQYSGDVSQYQDRLMAINQNMGQIKRSSDDIHQNRFMLLLGEIIGSNQTLQQRLESAETLLDQQTRQLQSYLSEARTDGLTGLSNRRALDKRMDELFAAYRSGGRSFTVALVDIDRFKSINDTHGHPAGDAVLRTLAQIFKNELSEADMVARFGGEEFAVLLLSPLKVAASRMNEIRKAIEKTEIETSKKLLSVTASIGLAEPMGDSLVAPVIRRADEALYAAKNVGRNRVYFHDGDKPTLVGAPEVAGRS